MHGLSDRCYRPRAGRSLVARIEEELGPVEILVNCAGVMYYTLMKNRREEEWERPSRSTAKARSTA